MLGKDQIAANFKEFLDLRNELIKTGKINPEMDSSNITDNISTAQTTSPEQTEPIYIAASTFSSDPWERQYYDRKNGYYPRYLYGRINPSVGSPRPGSNIAGSYHELEIYLNAGDAVEFISQHRSDMEAVWVAMYDDELTPDPYVNLVADLPDMLNVNGPIEFYFLYNPVTDLYYVNLFNPRTWETITFSWDDRGTSSTYIYIYQMAGSTELYFNQPPTLYPAWHGETTIEQWTTISGTTYYYPGQVFNKGGHSSRVPYVYAEELFNDGMIIKTLHKDGSDVP